MCGLSHQVILLVRGGGRGAVVRGAWGTGPTHRCRRAESWPGSDGNPEWPDPEGDTNAEPCGYRNVPDDQHTTRMPMNFRMSRASGPV